MRRRDFLQSAGAVLSAAALGACGRTTSAPQRASVPPPVPPDRLSGTVLQVGDQKGNQRSLLSAANLLGTPYRVEWSTFTSGPPLLEAVAAGAIDVGGVGNTPPLFAAAARADLSIVSAARQDPSSDAILVLPGSPLRAVGDLRGRRIGVAKGSSAHGNVLNVLASAGIRLDEVELSFMQPAEAYSAFTQRRLDAWAVWDPYTAQAELEQRARVLVDGRGTANGYSFEVAANDSLEDAEKNSAIADFVSRLARAQRFNAAHPEQRSRAWSAETGLPQEITLRAARRRHQLPVPLDDRLIASEQQLADAFAAARVLPAPFRFADFVDRRYDHRVVSAR